MNINTISKTTVKDIFANRYEGYRIVIKNENKNPEKARRPIGSRSCTILKNGFLCF
ncbi:hypothetical protein GCM10009120_29730 [Sphingobacterium siyangense subsp. cladoniae]